MKEKTDSGDFNFINDLRNKTQRKVAAWGNHLGNQISGFLPKRDGDRQSGSVKRGSRGIGLPAAYAAFRNFLALPENDRLAAALKSCYGQWAALQGMEEENAWAQAVLGAYYRRGKIKDTLAGLETFIGRIETISDPDTARAMGYANYIRFIGTYMEEMNRVPGRGTRKPFAGGPYPAEDVVWFIRAKCQDVGSLRELPQAWENAARLMEEGKNGGGYEDPRFQQEYSNITDASELLEVGRRNPQAEVEKIQAIEAGIRQQRAAMEENIRRAGQVFECLNRAMPQGWAAAFDPAAPDSPLGSMAPGEVKAFYTEKLRALREPLSSLE